MATDAYDKLVEGFEDAISSAVHYGRPSFDDAEKALRQAWEQAFSSIAREWRHAD